MKILPAVCAILWAGPVWASFCQGDLIGWHSIVANKAQALPPEHVHQNRSLEWHYGEASEFNLNCVDQDGVWAAGAVPGKHVLGIYLKSPHVEYRELAYTFFLRALFSGCLGRVDGINRPSWLTGEQVAYAFHSATGADEGAYWAIDGARFLQFQDRLPDRLRALPFAFFRFFKRHYTTRLRMRASDAQRLWKISNQLLSRSIVLLKTRNSFLHYGRRSEANAAAKLPLEINAGIVAVWSHAPTEPFPMELFNHEEIPRLAEVSAELGRFVVERGQLRDLSLRQMQAASTLLVGLGAREAKAEADLIRKGIFLGHGMSEQLPRARNYAGQPEWILTADPEVLVESTVDPHKEPLYRFKHRDQMLLYILERRFNEN